MLVRLTGFNQTGPMDDSQVVELESASIVSVVSSMTGDRHVYTTITNSIGETFFVRETIEQVNGKIQEALDATDAR
jgi:hypothetical protein